MYRTNADFINYLNGLAKADDKAALAELRRGLGKAPGSVPETYRHVMPFIPAVAMGHDDSYFIVASLFASYSDSMGNEDMGGVFRIIKDHSGNSAEGRFMALLKCHREELPDHLRHAISLASAKGVSVDWGQLLQDIQGWEDRERSVQRRWASSYWRNETPSENDFETPKKPEGGV